MIKLERGKERNNIFIGHLKKLMNLEVIIVLIKNVHVYYIFLKILYYCK